jgi:hypothetical protein
MTRPTNHQEATMYLVRTADGQQLALVRQVNTDANGVWTWMGYMEGATAEELTPGMTLTNWIMWGYGNDERRDWVCTKVNRVTARFTDGEYDALVRIDR